jgi:predicted RNase H-like HicB family nuclease
LATQEVELNMARTYSAIIQKHDEWRIGWIEELPGVNSKGRTQHELFENLVSAIGEALEMNYAGY